MARARPLQSLRLVRRGGPQPGAVRPPQTGIAPQLAPAARQQRSAQSNSPCRARLPSLLPGVAVSPQNLLLTRPTQVRLPPFIILKNRPLWTHTSLGAGSNVAGNGATAKTRQILNSWQKRWGFSR